MNAPTQQPTPEYTGHSTIESICMYCYTTVRVEEPSVLTSLEREHAAICVQRPDSLRKRPTSA